MILRRVNLEKLEYLGENETKFENISTQYSVAKADSNYEKNCSKILLDCPFKKDTEKSLDSAQYHTEQNLTPHSMILRRVNLEKREYLGKNETKFENISTQYSVAKADSNYEKNSSKILFDCPFKKDTEKSLDSAQYHKAQNLTPRSTV